MDQAERSARTDAAADKSAPPPVGRAVLLLTLGLWAFCFSTYYALSFLWDKGAPPLWMLGFNTLATLSGIAVSLVLAAALVRLDPRRRIGRIALAVVITLAAALLQSLVDQQMWREFSSHFVQSSPRPAGVFGVMDNFVQTLGTPISGLRMLSFVWVFGVYAASVVLLVELASGRRRERQLAEAHRMIRTAHLAALRYQLDPHFLFNCLNNVSSLIVSGRGAEAETMMLRLSDMMRTKLGGDPHQRKTLGEELDDVSEYLDIESVRFGDTLYLDVECPAELLDVEVPNFILQPLAENAVKHGVFSDVADNMLSIRAERQADHLVISVRNRIPGGEPERREGFGVGLTNTRKRLRAIYGDEGRLETISDARAFTARVIIPVARPADRPLH